MGPINLPLVPCGINFFVSSTTIMTPRQISNQASLQAPMIKWPEATSSLSMAPRYFISPWASSLQYHKPCEPVLANELRSCIVSHTSIMHNLAIHCRDVTQVADVNYENGNQAVLRKLYHLKLECTFFDQSHFPVSHIFILHVSIAAKWFP